MKIDFRESAKGGGTIRKKTITRNGKEYIYWEARITTGRAPGTGRQVQRSITGTYITSQIIQQFINSLQLAPATVRLNFRILHCALEKAVELEYIIRNPANRCALPRMEQAEIPPLDDQQIAALMKAAAGTSLEHLIRIALFTGMRESELLGLTWDCIDFDKNTIAVTKQLTRTVHRSAELFSSPKNGRTQTITPAVSVMQALRKQRLRLTEMQLRAGPMWDNAHNMVFATETGDPMNHQSVLNYFGKILKASGLEGIHFHDTRHPNVKPKTQIFSLGKQKGLIIILMIIRPFCRAIVPHTNRLV